MQDRRESRRQCQHGPEPKRLGVHLLGIRRLKSIRQRAIDQLFLSFREKQPAIDAVIGGQGIAICSDVVVSNELRSGQLLMAHPLALPGYGLYLVSMPDSSQAPVVEVFSTWMRAISWSRKSTEVALAQWQFIRRLALSRATAQKSAGPARYPWPRRRVH